MFGVNRAQGGDFLGPNLQRLEMFHRLGLRMMIPAYNTRSTLADGLFEPANAGLSSLGRAWVKACNRLGIVMDMTHVGERSTLEVLALSEDPVVFSHSNPRKLVDNVRNVTDEQISHAIVLLLDVDFGSAEGVVLAGSLWFTVFIVGSGFGWAVMPIVAAAAALPDWGNDGPAKPDTRYGRRRIHRR